jgi:hypothetical protein
MKKYFLSIVFIAVCYPAFTVINHSSVMGKNLPLYSVRNGATRGIATGGVTLDYKAVTVGTKTWVWTGLNGRNITSNNWSSRFRLWSPAKIAGDISDLVQENNVSDRFESNQTYGVVGIPDINPCATSTSNTACRLTFLQEFNNSFYETDDIAYNYKQLIPANANDHSAPEWRDAPKFADMSAQQLRLMLSASDDSGNFFYYIEDAENNFVEVSFLEGTAILDVDPDKMYYFTIYAIDFSGNQSEAATIFALPYSLRNGSDFYVIYMDAESEASFGAQVKEKSMFRDIDIDSQTLTRRNRTGENAWGIETSDSWVAVDVAVENTNGGAVVAIPDAGKTIDLSAIDDNYYFHFAIKSPASQPDVGWTLILYSDFPGDSAKFYVGPDNVASVRGFPWLGNYAHDDKWQHFEIPVSQLMSKGYKWNTPLSGRRRLLGFQSPSGAGTSLNLDAVFFYRKPAGVVSPPTGSVFTKGTANALDFKIDSRSLSEVKIECISDTYISDAFVKFELDGIGVAGQWKPVITDQVNGTNRYIITVPANQIHGWAAGATLSLNLAYKPTGRTYVDNNKIITEGESYGSRILHKIGTGVDISNLPDSIRNGSGFHIIYMDGVSEASLRQNTVTEKNMFCSYDMWGDNQLTNKTHSGENAWEVSLPWVAFEIVGNVTAERKGGAIVAEYDKLQRNPDLSVITANPNDYYFHFSVKSPANQPDAGCMLILYSDNTPATSSGGGLRYYVGPENANSSVHLGDYAHNGEWQHFEIPVSELYDGGYMWNGPLFAGGTNASYLFGFQDVGNAAGTELNLDAIFFYRKPLATGINTPPAIKTPVISVYPNPADNILYIKGVDSPVAVRILSLTGKAVLSQVIHKDEINISGLSRGIYFLKVKDQTVKFIKK